MANNDVLTEDEMGALMDSVSSDATDSGDVVDERGHQRFDFKRREQGLLAQVPALEMINERHVTSLSQALQDEFRLVFGIEVSETRILKQDEFLKSMPVNACINMSKLKPWRGLSLVVIPADLLSLLIDSYFGGALKPSYSETVERRLTASELSINRRINETFHHCIAEAWRNVLPLSPEIVGCETNPELLPVGMGDELAVLFNFDVAVAEHKMSIQWLFPYADLESVRKLLARSVPASSKAAVDADWEPLLRQELLQIDAELTAVLATLELPLGKILELAPGSVIPMRMPDRVGIYLECTRVAEAEYGSSKGKKAVKLIS
jgi:flagellar motor switch protein FliM